MADPLDLGDLGRRLASILGGPVDGLEVLPGGISSLTYLVSTGGRSLVAKVAPPGRRPVANRDVLRQARLMDSLADGPVPVPGIVATDDGDPPLFVMERVAGQSFEPATDTVTDPPTADVVRSRVLTAARTLVDMPSAPDGVEVTDLATELDRWRRLAETADLPGRAGPVAAGLAHAVPEDRPAVLAHGDYRLGNLLFEGTDLRGVIDWEIASWGDPRLDLAWLAIQTWSLTRPPLDPPDAAHVAAVEDRPTTDEVVAAYVEAGGSPPGDLGWFLALADFKIAATLAVLLKQNDKRPDPDPVFASRADTLAPTLERAAGHLAEVGSR